MCEVYELNAPQDSSIMFYELVRRRVRIHILTSRALCFVTNRLSLQKFFIINNTKVNELDDIKQLTIPRKP